ncbi:MAG: DUF420 domain-containing protein [Planctomycetota bacterium]|nr:MAG: DUF420 domain-containing protein [Planctomycetota bacterium]
MSHGFLGYDGSTFMFDFVVTALVLIVPALLVSLYLVKVQRNYTAHRNLQLALAGVLLVTVIAFEIDIRAHGGWRAIVDTRTVPLSAERLETVRQTLSVHLVFAISTPLLWGTTIALALKRMPRPPAPCEHSRLHKTLGWLSVMDLVLTSATGLLFYYRAFIA